MKTKEKAPARGRENGAWPLEGASDLEIVVHKDVKNEGRSHDVYENKDTHDAMAENKNDFVSENASNFQNVAAFDGQFGPQALFCRVFSRGNQGQ